MDPRVKALKLYLKRFSKDGVSFEIDDEVEPSECIVKKEELKGLSEIFDRVDRWIERSDWAMEAIWDQDDINAGKSEFVIVF